MNRLTAVAIIIIATVLAIPDPAWAVEFSVDPEHGGALSIDTGPTLELDLQRAYEIALARNLDLQVGRYDLAISDTQIQGASGIFDPSFNFGVNGNYTKSPTASELEGALVNETRNTNFQTGLDSLLPTGGTFGIDLRTSRTETNNALYFLNPSWSTQFGFNLNQPLLRNFGTTVNRSGIVVAQIARSQAADALKLQVMTTLQQVEDAYWDFKAAQVAVDVKKQSLELAEKLMEETKERIRVGTSAPIDLVQSEASVATRLQDLILARNARSNREDDLKRVLGFQTPGEWALTIAPVEPYVFEPLEVDLASSIETALANRPEIHQQKLTQESADLNTKLARNATLPSLDLNASYGWGGLGGTLNIDPALMAKSGFNNSLDQISDFDFPRWVLGATFTMPLGNNEAKANLAERRFASRQADTRMAALQQTIFHEVRFAVRYLHDGAAAVDAAEASRLSAERNVEAEQTKFQNGLSTNFLVLEIQDQLANAQLSDLQARLNYRKAIVAYRFVTGSLLENLGIEIADPGAEEPKHNLWKDVKWMQFVDFSKDSKPEEETEEADQD